jgi:hypothetical protein
MVWSRSDEATVRVLENWTALETAMKTDLSTLGHFSLIRYLNRSDFE